MDAPEVRAVWRLRCRSWQAVDGDLRCRHRHRTGPEAVRCSERLAWHPEDLVRKRDTVVPVDDFAFEVPVYAPVYAPGYYTGNYYITLNYANWPIGRPWDLLDNTHG
jgi:hypothetical protein